MTVCYFCGGKDTLADIGKELDDGKYKMVKCKKCKTAYYVVNKEKMNKQKPQTNEEWFCQLPTGEKAEFFANIYPKSVGEALIKISNGDKEKWEEWLKQPHTNEVKK